MIILPLFLFAKLGGVILCLLDKAMFITVTTVILLGFFKKISYNQYRKDLKHSFLDLPYQIGKAALKMKFKEAV